MYLTNNLKHKYNNLITAFYLLLGPLIFLPWALLKTKRSKCINHFNFVFSNENLIYYNFFLMICNLNCINLIINTIR